MFTCHGTFRFQKKHREWPWSIRLPPNSVRSSRIFQARSTCPDRKVRFSCSIYKPPYHLTLNKPPYPYVKAVEIKFIKGWPVHGKEASLERGQLPESHEDWESEAGVFLPYNPQQMAMKKQVIRQPPRGCNQVGEEDVYCCRKEEAC